MEHIILILFYLLCVGCNQQEFAGQKTHEYDQYLVDFNSDLARLGYSPIDFSHTDIRKGQTVSTANGLNARASCDSGAAVRHGGPVNITVISHFNENPDYHRKIIIYHELGHCFLGLKHSEVKTKWIMMPRDLTGVMSSDDVNDDTKRLQMVKEMLESSKYR